MDLVRGQSCNTSSKHNKTGTVATASQGPGIELLKSAAALAAIWV